MSVVVCDRVQPPGMLTPSHSVSLAAVTQCLSLSVINPLSPVSRAAAASSCTSPARSGTTPSGCASRSSWPTGSTWTSACRTLQELLTVASGTSPKLISWHVNDDVTDPVCRGSSSGSSWFTCFPWQLRTFPSLSVSIASWRRCAEGPGTVEGVQDGRSYLWSHHFRWIFRKRELYLHTHYELLLLLLLWRRFTSVHLVLLYKTSHMLTLHLLLRFFLFRDTLPSLAGAFQKAKWMRMKLLTTVLCVR